MATHALFLLTVRLTIVMITLCSTIRITQAQVSQQFTITVPERSSVVAPRDVAVELDSIEADSDLPTQAWFIESNRSDGIVATFSIDEPFSNTHFPQEKVDAELTVRVDPSDGTANFLPTSATAVTRNGPDQASANVQISSHDRGAAVVNVSVRILASQSATLVEGRYETHVICTLSGR